MDLVKILAELHAERDRVKMIIARLEAMQRPAAPGGWRGHKGMNPAARKAAAQRMKLYWAARKQQEASGNVPSERPE